MNMTLLRAADRVATSWKNGGGVTREVAVRPERPGSGGGASADFDWRVSLADIAEAGPFSSFDGYDRVITLIRGRGMVLTIDGADHRVDVPYAPLAFAGGSRTGCELIDGPIVDFNVMTRVGAVRATVAFVEVTRGGDGVSLAAGSAAGGDRDAAVAVVFEGRVSVVGGGEAVELGALDAVVVEGGLAAELRGAGDVHGVDEVDGADRADRVDGPDGVDGRDGAGYAVVAVVRIFSAAPAGQA